MKKVIRSEVVISQDDADKLSNILKENKGILPTTVPKKISNPENVISPTNVSRKLSTSASVAQPKKDLTNSENAAIPVTVSRKQSILIPLHEKSKETIPAVTIPTPPSSKKKKKIVVKKRPSSVHRDQFANIMAQVQLDKDDLTSLSSGEFEKTRAEAGIM